MRSRVLHMLGVLVLAPLAVLAPGCSDSTLTGGSQNINMTYTPSPSGAGRFDTASFFVNTVRALPADPAEAALFGAGRLIFRFTPFNANLVLTTPVLYSNITLSAGTYNVTQIQFTPPALVDEDLAPPPYANCHDGVAVYDAQSAPGIPATFTFDNPPSLAFTIQPGQTNLALTVDVPGLIAGYQASFTCQYVPCPGCPVDPRPTLTAFDQANFRAALLANITIE